MLKLFKTLLLLNLIVFILLSFNSCKKEETMPTPDLGYNYFPLKKGSSITYQVDSITWNDFYNPVKIDTFSFYIKMEIDSEFVDGENTTAYYYRKYYRTDTTSWMLVKNYNIKADKFKAETYEENFRYVKLVFPVNNSTIWDINAKNTFESTESYYEDFDIPMTINGLSFDSVAIVIHKNLETLIGKDYHQEVYAKNIGLVKKEMISIEKSTSGNWKNGYKCIYKPLSFIN